MKDDLKPYFVTFSVRGEKEWSVYSGYIFVKEQTSIHDLLTEKYGQVSIRSMIPVKVKEGLILYGERWRTMQ